MLVVYLTHAFINDEWRAVAVRTAHKVRTEDGWMREAPRTNRHRLQLFVQDKAQCAIVLLGQGVDRNELDGELGQILRRNAHIIDTSNV